MMQNEDNVMTMTEEKVQALRDERMVRDLRTLQGHAIGLATDYGYDNGEGALDARLAEIRSSTALIDEGRFLDALRSLVIDMRGDETEGLNDLLSAVWDEDYGRCKQVRDLVSSLASRLDRCGTAMLDGDHNAVSGTTYLNYRETVCSDCGEVLYDEPCDGDYYD